MGPGLRLAGCGSLVEDPGARTAGSWADYSPGAVEEEVGRS